MASHTGHKIRFDDFVVDRWRFAGLKECKRYNRYSQQCQRSVGCREEMQHTSRRIFRWRIGERFCSSRRTTAVLLFDGFWFRGSNRFAAKQLQSRCRFLFPGEKSIATVLCNGWLFGLFSRLSSVSSKYYPHHLQIDNNVIHFFHFQCVDTNNRFDLDINNFISINYSCK